MPTNGTKSKFRTKNEKEAEKYFSDALTGARLAEVVHPVEKVSYRLVGVWQQVWEQFQAQDEEVIREYEIMAREVWRRLQKGELVGRMLTMTAGYITRYQIDQYQPHHRDRLIAAYLWSCLTGRTMWHKFGGKSNHGWAKGGESAKSTLPGSDKTKEKPFEHDNILLLKKKHYEEVVDAREEYRDRHRDDWRTEEGYQ